VIAIALMTLAIGCMTTKQTESLLSEAGFKAVPAATPQQQAHLKTLPAGKVTKAQRSGKTYYVYPDVAHNVLYLGQEAQYQQYQKLCLQHETSSPGLSDAEINNEPGWGPWGGWGELWW
jgi:hypothetical protein